MKLKSALLPLCLLAALPSLAAARGLDVRDLQKLDRVSSPVLSPDGGTVVFAKRIVDADVVKASSSLWIRNLLTRDMAPPKRLTPEGWSVNSPAFSPDGSTVYFLSAKSGTQQLYAQPVAGGTPRQLTDFALDVASYKLSPDGTRVLFSTDTFADCKADFACTKKKLDDTAAKKSTGVIYDGLFVRHWDTWADGRRSRLFVAALPEGKGKPVATATSLTDTIDGDAPSKPFGGADEYTWSPDGGAVVAAIRVAGKGEAWSTNFDLYRIAADGSGAPVNLTAANPAWDTGPVFSADGKTLFYRAMKRPGFEADRFGLMAMDLASGKTRYWEPDLERYKHPQVPTADSQPDALGLHTHQGKRLLPLEDAHFAVKESQVPGQYRIEHPSRPDAYQPVLHHNGEGACFSNGLGIAQNLGLFGIRATACAVAAECVHRLRRQPHMRHHRHAPRGQEGNRLGHMHPALQLDRRGAGFGHQPRGVAIGLLGRFLIGPEGHVDHCHGLGQPPHHGAAMQDHHLQRHAHGIGQAVNRHPQAVSDQQHVAVRVQQGRHRRVIGRQADDGLAALAPRDIGHGDAFDALLGMDGHRRAS